MTVGALAEAQYEDLDAPAGVGFRLAVDRPVGARGALGATPALRELTGQCGVETVRVSAPDLRAAARVVAAARRAAAGQGRLVSVLLDIEVVLAEQAALARRRMAELEQASGVPRVQASLRYVGTPRGLAGLLSDIHVLGIADGVTLLPLDPGAVDELVGEVMPVLVAKGLVRRRR